MNNSAVTDKETTSAQEKKRVYPARIFHRATVVCPSCRVRFKEDSEQCPNCKFDAHRAVEQFPFQPPVMQRWMDNAKVLDEIAKQEIDYLINRLVKQFPQVSLSICTVELDDSIDLPEFGFWMMNACPLKEGQQAKDRAWRILLLVDVKREMISLTPGYSVEAFMNDADWQDALKMMIPNMIAGDYRASLSGFVKDAIELFRKSAQDVIVKLSQKES